MLVEQPAFALTLPETRTFDDWRDLGRRLCASHKAINFLIGDWLIEGCDRFGDDARAEANAIFRADVERFDPILKTCRKFPEPKRHKALSFSHHLAVLPMQDEDAERLLSEAERDRLPVRDLKRRVTSQRVATGELYPLVDDDPDDTAMRLIAQAWNRATLNARASFLELASEAEMGEIEL